MFITHKGKVMKNKRNQKNIIWKILLIIFSIVLIICLIIIGIQKYQQKKQQEYYEALLENESTQTQATEEMPEPETEEAPDILKSLGIEIPEKDIDFAALQEENSDVYAWIYVPGTNVDYPVLQHPEDDTYYLEHNMDGSKGLPGCIYSESVNTKDFTDPNTVLYGHNMKNGSMFASLHNFEDQQVFEENPYFYIYNALLSRCTVFEFKSLSAADVERGIRNALKKLSESESQPVVMDEDACAYLAESAGGDLRKALGCLDFVVTAAPVDETGKHITLEMIQQVTRRTAMRYDRDGDDHYDIVSAYQKSMRGSDPNAALHYLARLLEAGDLPSACRRLMVCACEDVGLAYPQIIPIVKAAVDAANMVGLPEARLPLADAVILVATSPKSNSAHDAINAAIADVQAGRTGPIPRQLQNKHFDGEDAAVKGQNYKYAHDYENHWVDQQYLPDLLKDVKYYTFGDNRTEQAARAYWAKIKGEDKL